MRFNPLRHGNKGTAVAGLICGYEDEELTWYSGLQLELNHPDKLVISC